MNAFIKLIIIITLHYGINNVNTVFSLFEAWALIEALGLLLVF
jgi:hypothetical protein